MSETSKTYTKLHQINSILNNQLFEDNQTIIKLTEENEQLKKQVEDLINQLTDIKGTYDGAVETINQLTKDAEDLKDDMNLLEAQASSLSEQIELLQHKDNEL